MHATTKDASLDQAINNAFSQLRDVTLRDGIQSWDGNKWKIEEILPVAKELNELVTLGKKRGVDMPSAEVWGGGQVVQPALFNGEDPFINAEELHTAMPKTALQCLYRGRQGFGFKPISVEVQEKAIEAAAKRGMKVFRIFDMMNDPENVKPGMEAMQAYKNKHGTDSITVEGAISYISAPDKGQRAMTPDEYGEYAVQLAKMGADEIAIKNYAGVGDKEMPELIHTIRSKLKEAGHPNMKVNLHDHGQKPDVLAAALEAGADKVDVAIGMLSDGPSHTNMRNAIYHLLEKEGFDTSQPITQTAINHHPMMKQLKRVEDAIEAVVKQERMGKNGEATSYKNERKILEGITQEDADHYRVAGGALSDLSGRIAERYSKGRPKNFPEKEDYFKRILENGLQLWEKAGQFNTVTPGALILLEQAMIAVDQEIYGQKMTLDKYKKEYVDIAVGRFGKNRGMEKGLGDTTWRDTMMMYRALKLINEGLKDGRISDADMGLLTLDAALGSKGSRLILTTASGKKQIDLKDTALEDKLNVSDIERFRHAVQKAGFDDSLKSNIMTELTVGRSADPTEGMEFGRAKVAALKNQGIDTSAMHETGHRISTPEDVALLSMILPENAFSKVISTVQKSGPVVANQSEEGKKISHLATQMARATGDRGVNNTLH